MSAKSFLVFGSYVEGANCLNDKDRLSFYDGLMAYASLGIEFEMRPNARALFLGVKPTVDKNLEIRGNAVNAGVASGEVRRKKREEKLRLESENDKLSVLDESGVGDSVVSVKKEKKCTKKSKEEGAKTKEEEIPCNVEKMSPIQELKSGILVETCMEESVNENGLNFAFESTDTLTKVSQSSETCLNEMSSASQYGEEKLVKGVSENLVSFCSNSVPNGVGGGNGSGIGNGKEAAAADAAVCLEVQREFLELCPRLDKVLMLTKKQRKLITQRVEEYGRENVTKMLKKAGCSDFLCGLVNCNFKADFSWIFHEDHFESILNGKYDQVWNQKKKPTVVMEVHDVRENPFRKGDV